VYTGQERKADFSTHQPPEVANQGLMPQGIRDIVNNDRRNPGGCKLQAGNNQAEDDSPRDDSGTGLPQNVEDRGNILECANAVTPGTVRPGLVLFIHKSFVKQLLWGRKRLRQESARKMRRAADVLRCQPLQVNL
jgi:hypothetical protein